MGVAAQNIAINIQNILQVSEINYYSNTHIVGYCEISNKLIIQYICNNVFPIDGDKYLIEESIDFLEGKHMPPEHIQSQFKLKINISPTIRL
ncbi:hypothetical protein RIR_jg38789.t1 [Rhizophagus irregularis DAOM 181602=DAOM 197198]|nr:hypothetical protein RIR_jg38789.t1 [Rhizophagus irregularis DAOM 181602=DAOM 197198]